MLCTFYNFNTMKNLNLFIWLLATICLISTNLLAQTTTPDSLIKQGTVLHDQGRYDEAIAKYDQVLKVEPDYWKANYEKGFTLYVSGKGKDAIPFLETALKNTPNKGEAYDLLGSIYDDSNEPDKAIACYQNGINADPTNERLRFNIGVSYLRQNKSTEAEQSEMEAIKLDPKHASAQRIYGLATYNEGKKVCAVMAFCNFLLLEPQTARSKQVYGYLDKIFKNEEAKKNINLTIDSGTKEISPMSMANMSVNLAAAAKLELAKKNVDSVETLELALKMIFESVGKISAKPTTKKDFFWNFYADYFYKLAESGNMPAFVRLISLSAYGDENLAWFKANSKTLGDLDLWIRSNERSVADK